MKRIELKSERTEGLAMVRILAALLLLWLAVASVTPATARGGQAADDCPPASKDPDCAK